MLITNIRDARDGWYLVNSSFGDGACVRGFLDHTVWVDEDVYKKLPNNRKVLHIKNNLDSVSVINEDYIGYDIVEQGEYDTESPTQYVYVITQTKLENKNDVFTASSRVIDVCESADKAIEVAQGFTETSIVKMEVKK